MKILITTIVLLYTVQAEYEFPKDFIFGVATSSYQVEGAWDSNGKTPNIWDHITHTKPSVIKDSSNGDIACDAYHQTATDVQLLKQLGVQFYRFSLSWTRILPTGFTNFVNPDGVRYYNELIDTLISNNIEPYVTIYHWDLPQSLQDLGGWTNPRMIDYFSQFARKTFELFGDRVKFWITINEPRQICQFGYGDGFLAPYYVHNNNIGAYLCDKTILLAHANAYHIYDKEFRPKQKGRIGITIETSWFEGVNNTKVDNDSAERRLQFDFGIYAHPIFTKKGDWPEIVKQRIADNSRREGFRNSRLPSFTPAEIKLLRGSSDFLGFNHYTAYLCNNYHTTDVVDTTGKPSPSYDNDVGAFCIADPRGAATSSDYFRVTPTGFFNTLKWLRDQYGDVEIVVTENGYAGFPTDGVNDCARIEFYNLYLENLLKAIHEEKINISTFTGWSFMDNFEWSMGYLVKFGFFDVDFNSPMRNRRAKQSVAVYKKIIETERIDWDYTPAGFTKCEFHNKS